VETILIVDDEPEVCTLAVDILQAIGYRTLNTGDPMLALRIARTETKPIHLLLTDVVMPVMNGRELAEQVRVIRPAIKVLFMSAYTTETVVDYGIRIAPGEPFVVKPFTIEALAAKVRAILDYRSPFGKRPSTRS
jgi:DNA-binding response OmpR family regulator